MSTYHEWQLGWRVNRLLVPRSTFGIPPFSSSRRIRPSAAAYYGIPPFLLLLMGGIP